jgi:hypothetical protein
VARGYYIKGNVEIYYHIKSTNNIKHDDTPNKTNNRELLILLINSFITKKLKINKENLNEKLVKL